RPHQPRWRIPPTSRWRAGPTWRGGERTQGSAVCPSAPRRRGLSPPPPPPGGARGAGPCRPAPSPAARPAPSPPAPPAPPSPPPSRGGGTSGSREVSTKRSLVHCRDVGGDHLPADVGEAHPGLALAADQVAATYFELEVHGGQVSAQRQNLQTNAPFLDAGA